MRQLSAVPAHCVPARQCSVRQLTINFWHDVDVRQSTVRQLSAVPAHFRPCSAVQCKKLTIIPWHDVDVRQSTVRQLSAAPAHCVPVRQCSVRQLTFASFQRCVAAREEQWMAGEQWLAGILTGSPLHSFWASRRFKAHRC